MGEGTTRQDVRTVRARGRRGPSMSPMQLVEAECANFVRSGRPAFNGCILPPEGVAEGACLVRDGKRCRYFEAALLPLGEKDDIAEAARYRAAADTYRTAHGLAGAGERRHCECGAPIQKRRRMCEACRALRRRETRRHAQRKWRVGM